MKHRKLAGLTSLILASMLMIQPVMAQAVETVEESAGEVNETHQESAGEVNETTEENPGAAAETRSGYEIEAKTFPCLSQYSPTEEPKESEITLYFVDGGDIPYVSLNDYMTFLGGWVDDTGSLVYNVESDSETLFRVTRDENDSSLYIDTEEDYMFFLNMNGFEKPVGAKAAVTTRDLPETEPVDLDALAEFEVTLMESLGDNPEEKMEELMNAIQAESETDSDAPVTPDLFSSGGINGLYYNRAGAPVEFRFDDYMIDLVSVDGVCYIPYQTMNDIFLNSQYIHAVFTGEKVLRFTYGIDFSEQRFEVPEGTLSEDFAIFNYNELRFMLDNFYGLKSEHNIRNFGELMAMDTDLIQDLAGTDPRKFDTALIQLIGMYLDDGHSAFIGNSVLSGGPTPMKNQILSTFMAGPSTLTSENAGRLFREAREAVYGENVPGYEEVGDTAFITFDDFLQMRKDEEYYNADLTFDDPQDTIELIIYANRQIKRENSPIRNIVLDMSNNTGGRSSAAIFVMSWLLGNAQIALRDTLTGAQTNIIYQCDTNLDGKFDQDNDTVSSGYRLYCLTSINSFSCGNLVPAACKNSGIVTVVGQTSGGGSCIVMPATTASGALFQISGPSQLSIIKNGTFYNIDQGIEPDFVLSKPESFYDRASLAEYLKELR